MWLGFWPVPLDPSPKSHAHEVGFPVDVSVNFAVNGGCPLTGAAVKDAFTSTGPGIGAGVGVGVGVGVVTVIKSVMDVVELPSAFVAFIVMV